MVNVIKERWNNAEYREKCIKNLDFSSETQSRRAKLCHKKHKGFNKEYLIAYNKSEKGRNESRRRAAYMRDLLKTKTEDELKIINLKRKLAKGLFSKKDHFNSLKLDELKEKTINNLKQIYYLDKNYILSLNLSEEVMNEISK